MLIIEKPIWKTPRSIGIAEFRLTHGKNLIKIAYKDGSGEPLYPNTYSITRERALTYPRQIVGKGKPVVLRVIPIEELDIEVNAEPIKVKEELKSETIVSEEKPEEKQTELF